MADIDDIKDGKDFGLDTPQDKQGFFLKGGANYDWGIKNRMSRIFNPNSGRTVMLAFDHGYFQGPTKGLERIDLNILPLAEHADVLMCTRGILRSVIPPTVTKPIVMRASGGNSILSELSKSAWQKVQLTALARSAKRKPSKSAPPKRNTPSTTR